MKPASRCCVQGRVDAINALEPKMKALSDEALRGCTVALQARYERGETLDDLLVDAFAVRFMCAGGVLGVVSFSLCCFAPQLPATSLCGTSELPLALAGLGASSPAGRAVALAGIHFRCGVIKRIACCVKEPVSPHALTT